MPVNNITPVMISSIKGHIARSLIKRNPDYKKIPEVHEWLKSLEYEAAVNAVNFINKMLR